MRLSIIGASKGVGIETVIRALERDHHVITLSRSFFNIPTGKRFQKLIGNAVQKEDLRNAIDEVDAIIVTLGTGNNPTATTLYTDFAKTLLELHKEQPIRVPIIILTGFGAGESVQYFPFYMRWVFKTILGAVYTNKSQMEKMIIQSDLRWTIVRPGILTNGPLTENYKVETHLYEGIKPKKISRADLADSMIKLAESDEHPHSYVYLT